MLSRDHVERYGRDGFIAGLPAVSPLEAQRYLARLAAFEAETGLVAGNVIRNKGHLKLTWLFELVSSARILDAVEAILGRDILCWASSLFVKEAGAPSFVAWHQDSYFYSHYWGLETDDIVSAWIAFAPSTEENGAMRVIPGSHREPRRAHVASPRGSANMQFTHEEVDGPIDERAAVSLILDPGQMSLHHVNLLHSSRPNRSGHRRCGFAIRYVAPHVRHRANKWSSAVLVRGTDRYGHFTPDPIPTRDMDPEIVAFVDGRFGSTPRGVD